MMDLLSGSNDMRDVQCTPDNLPSLMCAHQVQPGILPDSNATPAFTYAEAPGLPSLTTVPHAPNSICDFAFTYDSIPICSMASRTQPIHRTTQDEVHADICRERSETKALVEQFDTKFVSAVGCTVAIMGQVDKECQEAEQEFNARTQAIDKRFEGVRERRVAFIKSLLDTIAADTSAIDALECARATLAAKNLMGDVVASITASITVHKKSVETCRAMLKAWLKSEYSALAPPHVADMVRARAGIEPDPVEPAPFTGFRK
jgi:hypothetical protein